MAARYKVTSGWVVVNKTAEVTQDGETVTLTRAYAKLTDTRGRWVYDQGAWKVTARYDDGTSFVRAKTFKGETAWNDSERLYDDLVWKVRRAERSFA